MSEDATRPEVPGQINGLEPPGLIAHFFRHPPKGFESWQDSDGTVGFDADFDILTTAPRVSRKLDALPLGPSVRALLTWRTAFVGTTVTEYACLPDSQQTPNTFISRLIGGRGKRQKLLIIKDLPHASPLLTPRENAWSEKLLQASQAAGLILVEGQALAYLPMDFESIDAYLARQSYAKRKDLRRKLRSRAELEITEIPTGTPYLSDPDIQQQYYALYEQVFDQSELKFDKLTPAFFAALLTDAKTCPGVVMEYRHHGTLIGFNLSYVHNNNLVDKYIGMKYPEARKLNVYFVSWIVNLEYALARGCSYYIAGWTDPKIKARLGAQFTSTWHAVHVRHTVLRWVLARVTRLFENDRAWAQPQVRSDAQR